MSNERCRPAPAPAIGQSFDDVVLPHLNAAYRLARWRLRHEQDAEDVVQEALLRAFRYFRTFTGGNGRAWFLRIVRNTSCGWRDRSFHAPTDLFDEAHHSTFRPGFHRILKRCCVTPRTCADRASDEPLAGSFFAKCSCSANWRSCHARGTLA